MNLFEVIRMRVRMELGLCEVANERLCRDK